MQCNLCHKNKPQLHISRDQLATPWPGVIGHKEV